MKILYVIPDPDRIGGVSTSVKRITQYLINKGFDLTICGLDFEPKNDNPISEMIVLKDLLRGTLMQENTQKVIEKINHTSPDLIVGYYGTTAAYCATAAAKLVNLPIVVCLRGNDVNRDFFSTFHAHKLAFVGHNASAITTVSTEMSLKLKAWLGIESKFISNSVDKSLFFNDKSAAINFKQSHNLNKKPIIGLFGEFKHSRGIKLLNNLKQELKAFHVMIVGHIRKDYENKLDHDFIIIPYIKEKEALRAAYSSCDIILQPSKYDGMPNVVLEAMACERIVIASSVGGIKDIIRNGQNGYLCDTIESWKQSIRDVLQNINPELGINARNSVMDVKQEAKAFITLFKAVCDRHINK